MILHILFLSIVPLLGNRKNCLNHLHNAVLSLLHRNMDLLLNAHVVSKLPSPTTPIAAKDWFIEHSGEKIATIKEYL